MVRIVLDPAAPMAFEAAEAARELVTAHFIASSGSGDLKPLREALERQFTEHAADGAEWFANIAAAMAALVGRAIVTATEVDHIIWRHEPRGEPVDDEDDPKEDDPKVTSAGREALLQMVCQLAINDGLTF